MEGGSGPNGRQGRNIPHGDVNHKEWRDRSEAVGTTNVVGVWRGRSAGTMIFGRDGAPGLKRRCGLRFRRQDGRAQTRLRRLGTTRSPPISRSAEWPRAGARGIALRCSSAATARCDGVRENARIGARPGRAISARPPQVHAPMAVSTWRGCIGSLFAMCDCVGSTRKQRLTAYGYPLCRITRRITVHIIVRFRKTQGMRVHDR
jgi:hypothetical protein